MKILISPEHEEFYRGHKRDEYDSLMKGKITVRFLQHSGYWYIFSGNTRPSIQGFDDELEAVEWLKDNHGIDI